MKVKHLKNGRIFKYLVSLMLWSCLYLKKKYQDLQNYTKCEHIYLRKYHLWNWDPIPLLLMDGVADT